MITLVVFFNVMWAKVDFPLPRGPTTTTVRKANGFIILFQRAFSKPSRCTVHSGILPLEVE